MADQLERQELEVILRVSVLAGRVFVDDDIRGERRARLAAEDVANEVAVLVMMSTPKRLHFVHIAGALAARHVRHYG